MFSIVLYKFSKKLNSTALPTNSTPHDTFSCNFLDSQSIVSPIIVIEDTKAEPSDMSSYNYAYIENLGRYYFIHNTVILGTDRYCYYLQVDVLASFRASILASTQYVIRSTNNYNEYIIDKMYPTLPMPTSDQFAIETKLDNIVYALDNKTGSWVQKDFFNAIFSDGCIVFGVTGVGSASVNYYVADVTYFRQFLNGVVTATPTGFNWGNLPTGVQATMSNLMQYITFAKWLPFFPESGNLGTLVTSIALGSTDIPITRAYKVTAGLHHEELRFSLTVPDHPLVNEHLYYNFSPYREVGLFFFPIGIVPIDTSKLYATQQSVFVTMNVDLASGDTLFVVSSSGDGIYHEDDLDNVLHSSIGNIAVNISLSDYSLSMEAALASAGAGFIGNALSSTFGAAQGSEIHTSSSGATHGGHGGTFEPLPRAALTGHNVIPVSNIVKNTKQDLSGIVASIGNGLGSFGDILTTLSDFISSSFGQITMKGKTDSFAMFYNMPAVFCWFKKHGTEDYNRFGRPFCEQKSLSLCSGFCICKNSYISTFAGTQPLNVEINSINNLLDTGIYVE